MWASVWSATGPAPSRRETGEPRQTKPKRNKKRASSSPSIYQVFPSDLLERRRPGLPHNQLQFAPQYPERRLDAGLTESRQSPHVGTAYADGFRAEGQGLEDVRPPAKPPVNQHGNLSGDAFHDFRQALDGRAIALLASTAVIRHDDAIGAALDRELGVLARDDALDDQLHRRDVSQAFDDLPVHVQRVLSDDPGQIEALKHRPAANCRVVSKAADVTDDALPRVYAPGLQHRLPVGPSLQINGQNQHRAARGLGSFSQSARDVPIVRRIELVPDGSAHRLVDGFDRRTGHCGKYLEVSLRASGFGHRDFTFGMERLLTAHWSERDGIVPGGAENTDGGIDVPDVSQPADPDLIFCESFMVGAQCGVVVHTGRKVTEVGGRQLLARYRLELHHVEGLLGG